MGSNGQDKDDKIYPQRMFLYVQHGEMMRPILDGCISDVNDHLRSTSGDGHSEEQYQQQALLAWIKALVLTN